MSITEPKQNPDHERNQYTLKASGGGGAVAIGAIMLVAGMVCRFGHRRVFIGLIAIDAGACPAAVSPRAPA